MGYNGRLWVFLLQAVFMGGSWVVKSRLLGPFISDDGWSLLSHMQGQLSYEGRTSFPMPGSWSRQIALDISVDSDSSGAMDSNLALSTSSGSTKLWPQVIIQTTEVGMVPAAICSSDSNMVTGGGPEAGILVAFGDNVSNVHHRRASWK